MKIQELFPNPWVYSDSPFFEEVGFLVVKINESMVWIMVRQQPNLSIFLSNGQLPDARAISRINRKGRFSREDVYGNGRPIRVVRINKVERKKLGVGYEP